MLKETGLAGEGEAAAAEAAAGEDEPAADGALDVDAAAGVELDAAGVW